VIFVKLSDASEKDSRYEGGGKKITLLLDVANYSSWQQIGKLQQGG